MFKKFSTTNVKYASVLFFVLLSIYPVYGKTMYNGVHILVGVIPDENEMEGKLNNLIYNLLVYDFESSGLITEKIDLTPNDSPELLLSSKSETGLAAICTYTKLGNRVLLDLELYDSRTMLVLASSSASADLNLSFDKVVSSVVADLLKDADEQLKKRVINTKYEDLSGEKVESTQEDLTQSNLSVSEKVQSGGFELFINAGTVLGIGDSSQVLGNPGISTGLSLNYWIFTKLGYLGFGAETSANLFSLTGQNEKSSLLLFPVGLHAAYSSPTSSIFSISLQFGAGPAIVSLIYKNADPLMKLIPYLCSDFGLSFNFNKRMSLGLMAAYNIYFEEASVLTTLSTSAYMSFRSWN